MFASQKPPGRLTVVLLGQLMRGRVLSVTVISCVAEVMVLSTCNRVEVVASPRGVGDGWAIEQDDRDGGAIECVDDPPVDVVLSRAVLQGCEEDTADAPVQVLAAQLPGPIRR